MKKCKEIISFKAPDKIAVCAICLYAWSEKNDELIYCELCNYMIHQSCYGSELAESIPKDDFYCSRCKYLTENKAEPDSVMCNFCPELHGLIKAV